MSNLVKGRGQRLIPEELLKYLEAYKEAHPDPTAGGPKLFMHGITLKSTNSFEVYIISYNDSDTPVNSIDGLKNFVENYGFHVSTRPDIYSFFDVHGFVRSSETSPRTLSAVAIIYVSESLRVMGYAYNSSSTDYVNVTGAVTISDVIKEVL